MGALQILWREVWRGLVVDEAIEDEADVVARTRFPLHPSTILLQ